MDVKDLMLMQVAFDEGHGFPVQFSSRAQRYAQITKDLVGLMGELGEFANVVKKINLAIDNPTGYQFDIAAGEEALREELVDFFIYVARLSSMLNLDIEAGVVSKLQINADRYSALKK
jgi:NTP pyrophosphatase (non-canonical NTP hydrolase)